MELERIKPGKPMDGVTFYKYLRQGNISIKLRHLGKPIIPYDIKFIIINNGPQKGGITYNILFGNFFNKAKRASSIAITSGQPYKSEAVVCHIDSPFSQIKETAIGFERVPNKDGFQVKMPKGDRKKLAEDFFKLLRETGQKVPHPIKLHASVHVECSLIPVPQKPFFILKVDREDRYEEDTDAKKRRHEAQRFFQGFVVNKPTLYTDIVDRIKGFKGKKAKIEVAITPEMAEDLMTINTDNRQIRIDDVFKWGNKMGEGKWTDNSQSTMEISWDDKIIDGQHRLLSIIKSGKTINMTLYCGSDPNNFKDLDSGRPRTQGDTASVRRLPDPTQSAATINFVLSITKYNMVSGTHNVISNFEIDEWLTDESNARKLKDVLTSSYKVYAKYGAHLMTKTIYTGMLLLLKEKHKSEADAFMEMLVMGENLSRTENSSIFYLRKILENWEKSGLPKSAKGNEMRTRWIITAWNWFRQKDSRGKPIIINKLELEQETGDLPKISR